MPRVPHDRDLAVVQRILSKDLPVVFQANRENEIHRALNVAKEFGLTTEEGMGGGAVAPIPEKVKGNPPAIASEVWDNIHAGASQAMADSGVSQRFQPGDRVRTLAQRGFGHTRLPRYARGKTGVRGSLRVSFGDLHHEFSFEEVIGGAQDPQDQQPDRRRRRRR